MLRRCSVILLAVCGCAQEPPPEPKIFGRVDCQIAAGNPELIMEFERARAICLGRAEAAAVAGTTGIRSGPGLAGAIAAGIERSTAQTQITESTTTSCMAEQGYLYRTKPEHDAACASIRTQRETKAAHKARPKK